MNFTRLNYEEAAGEIAQKMCKHWYECFLYSFEVVCKGMDEIVPLHYPSMTSKHLGALSSLLLTSIIVIVELQKILMKNLVFCQL